MPKWESPDFRCEATLGLQVVGVRLPPYLPHVNPSFPPEKEIGGEEVNASDTAPHWEHPKEWNLCIHAVAERKADR
jgi:hypothetical protein